MKAAVLVLDEWVPYRREDLRVRMRVFGFPHAGGNASFYHGWRKLMPPDIDFCPVELPGHGPRMDETPLTDLHSLVATLQVILEPLLMVPFAFFGHSAGACIAFESARAIHSGDERSAIHLFVSGYPAPDTVMEHRTKRSQSDQDLIAALIRYGGTPAAIIERTELMAAILPALRADLALVENYCPVPGTHITCPITVFSGAGDIVDSASLQAWSTYTSGAFRVQMFEGGHFYLSEATSVVVDQIIKDMRLHGQRLAGVTT
jgi:medium-chain acyl-[acyl-carrier-protein] hydrolase